MANDFSTNLADGGVWYGVWRMESTATLGDDDSGYSHTLTKHNTPVEDTTNQIEGSGCGDFERNDAEALYIDDSNLNTNFPLKSGGSSRTFTVFGWWKSEYAIGGSQTVFSKWQGSDYQLRIYNHSTNGWTVGIGYSNWSEESVTPNVTAPTDGRWMFWCLTHDGSSKAWNFYVYDSVVGEESDNGTFTNTIGIDDAPVCLGAQCASDAPSASFVDGLMDETGIADGVATSTEVWDIKDFTYGAAAGLGIPLAMHHYKMLRQ